MASRQGAAAHARSVQHEHCFSRRARYAPPAPCSSLERALTIRQQRRCARGEARRQWLTPCRLEMSLDLTSHRMRGEGSTTLCLGSAGPRRTYIAHTRVFTKGRCPPQEGAWQSKVPTKARSLPKQGAYQSKVPTKGKGRWLLSLGSIRINTCIGDP